MLGALRQESWGRWVKVAVEVAKANQEAASTTHFQVRDFRAGLGPL